MRISGFDPTAQQAQMAMLQANNPFTAGIKRERIDNSTQAIRDLNQMMAASAAQREMGAQPANIAGPSLLGQLFFAAAQSAFGRQTPSTQPVNPPPIQAVSNPFDRAMPGQNFSITA